MKKFIIFIVILLNCIVTYCFASEVAYLVCDYEILKIDVANDTSIIISSSSSGLDGLRDSKNHSSAIDYSRDKLITVFDGGFFVYKLKEFQIIKRIELHEAGMDYLGSVVIYPDSIDMYYVVVGYSIGENLDIKFFKYCFSKSDDKLINISNIDYDLINHRFWLSSTGNCLYYYDKAKEILNVVDIINFKTIKSINMSDVYTAGVSWTDIKDVKNGHLLLSENDKNTEENNYYFYLYDIDTNVKTSRFYFGHNYNDISIIDDSTIAVSNVGSSNFIYFYNYKGELLSKIVVEPNNGSEFAGVSYDGKNLYYVVYGLYDEENNRNDTVYIYDVKSSTMIKSYQCKNFDGISFDYK